MKGFKRTAAVWFGVAAVTVLVLLVAAPVAPAAVPTGSWVFTSQFGSPGSGDGQFAGDIGVIACDGHGTLYIADRSNDRVEVWTTDGDYVTSFGSTGTGDGQFEGPFGLALTPDGSIYVSEELGARVQKLTTKGVYQSELDGFGGGLGVAVDSTGAVWATDTGNGLLKKFDSDGNPLLSLDGTSSGTAFSTAVAVAVDSAGNAYVTDAGINNRVVVFDKDGHYLRQWPSPNPWAIALDPAGHVFVSDRDASGTVIEYSSAGATLATIASPYVSSGAIYGIAADGKGHLWLADSWNSVVVEFTWDKPAITSDADGEWHSQETTVNFTATDSVSGIKEIDYSTDGGVNWVQGDSVTEEAPADHSNDGIHTIQVRAISNEGNTTFSQARVKIDTQQPLVTGDGPFEQWMPGTQYFWFTGSDVGSGVGTIWYSLDGGPATPVGTDGMITVSGDGVHTISYWATDNCVDTPNQSDVMSDEFGLDSVKPIATTVNNVVVTYGKKATFRYVANDTLSPRCWVDITIMKKGKLVKDISVGSKTAKATAQSFVWTCKLAKGSYTWRVVVWDMAGNMKAGAIKKLTVK